MGVGNMGNRNRGDWNHGDENHGNRNRGNRNEGNRNEGNGNRGNQNEGNRNAGHGNWGNGNCGNINNGNFNLGHYNQGHFNVGSKVKGMFNKECDVSKVIFPNWISRRMHDPGLGWQEAFEQAEQSDLANTLKLPNFSAEIFREITGLDIFSRLEKQ